MPEVTFLTWQVEFHFISQKSKRKRSTKLTVRVSGRKSRKPAIGELGSIKIILHWRNWNHFIKVLWCVFETPFHIETAILILSWYKLSGIHWSQFPPASDLVQRYHLLLSTLVSSSIIYTGIRMKCTFLHIALCLTKTQNCANIEEKNNWYRIKLILMTEKFFIHHSALVAL